MKAISPERSISHIPYQQFFRLPLKETSVRAKAHNYKNLLRLKEWDVSSIVLLLCVMVINTLRSRPADPFICALDNGQGCIKASATPD